MNEVVHATVDGCGVARKREDMNGSRWRGRRRGVEERGGLARWKDIDSKRARRRGERERGRERRRERKTEKGKPRRIPRYHDN